MAYDPSYLFHTVKEIVQEKQLEPIAMLELSQKSWKEICEELELGTEMRKSFSKNEGRAITTVAIEDYLNG